MTTGSRSFFAAALLAAFVGVPSGAIRANPGGVSLDSVTPARQRVHEIITLQGSGFGSFSPGVSQVVFSGGKVTMQVGMAYVWRDDFIQVRVPVGQRIDEVNVPIPKTPLSVSVIGVNGESSQQSFQVITAPNGVLSFVERTHISNSDTDDSGFFGSTGFNLARTKDADIGDANGDAFPDLIDNNSNNSTNGTHAVLHLNNGGRNFTSIDMEPIDSGDGGTFATVIDLDGDFVGNAIVYDADFVDLNNDSLPELVQACAGGGGERVRLLVNNEGGVPGMFHEDTASWFPGGALPGSPDDICHIDADHDGFVDVAVSFRFSNQAKLYVNDAGQTFDTVITISAPSGSMHDVFFIDANADTFPDVVLVNESGNSRLLLHEGNPVPTFELDLSINASGFAGIAADFDGDGLTDFAITGTDSAQVFLNDPDNPGSFSQTSLSGAVSFIYDVEVGDIDLDGTVDIVGAAITGDGDDAARIWLNNGDGTFVNVTSPTAQVMLPGLADYQRLSADLIDFDQDDDLDLYITGADGQNVGQGFGVVPNQFFENMTAMPCAADLNGDGSVATADLLALLSAWGPNPGHPADLNGDGVVATADLLELLSAWGSCT